MDDRLDWAKTKRLSELNRMLIDGTLNAYQFRSLKYWLKELDLKVKSYEKHISRIIITKTQTGQPSGYPIVNLYYIIQLNS